MVAAKQDSGHPEPHGSPAFTNSPTTPLSSLVFQRIVPDMTGQLIVEKTVRCNEPRRGRPIDEHQQYADKTKRYQAVPAFFSLFIQYGALYIRRKL